MNIEGQLTVIEVALGVVCLAMTLELVLTTIALIYLYRINKAGGAS